MRILLSSIILTCILTAGMSGCGNSVPGQVPTLPVKGTLTLDGKPFGPARLMFHPDSDKKPSPSALVDASGNIVVTTYSNGDGAPAGSYKVTISSDPSVATPPHPQPYRTPESSPLTLTVASGTSEFKLDLDSKLGPAAQGGVGVPLGVQVAPGSDPAAAYRNAAPAKP